MYDGFGLTVGFCRSPRVQNITIYSAAGMGLCGVCNENFAIDRLRIERRPGSDRLISICADGIHNYSGIGKISISNCLIKDSADDCINITAQYLIIVKPVDARTLLIRKADRSPFTGAENDTPLPHTSYALINALTLEKLGEASLVASELGKEAILHFDRDLPNLRQGDLLFDNSHSAGLTVSDCVFPGSRGRGVLAHNDVLIERCKFRNQGNEAILLMADSRDSFEGPNIESVKIFQNEIDNSYRSGVPSVPVPVGAIRLSARVPLGNTPGIVNQDVEISSNHIRGSSTAGIVANYTQRLMINNNSFGNIQGAAIVTNRVRSTSIIDNVCSPAAKLVIDPSSKHSVALRGNIGLDA